MGDAANRFPFTRPRLDAETAPAKGRKEVWDAEVRALCCRITASGDRTLWLCKWSQGGVRWIKIGDHPACSIKEARSRALDLLSSIAKGERPWEERRALREEATLADLWAHYLEHAKAHKRASSLESDLSIWRTVLAPWGEKRRIGSLSRGEVQKLINTKGKEAPIRANRAAALLSTIFNKAIASDLWKGGNPVEGVQRFKEVSRDRFLNQVELRSLFAALAFEDDGWRVYFRASVLGGARRANLLAMKWADLDLARGLWRIAAEESKNGEVLQVILPVELVTNLREWRAACSSRTWVFPSDDSDTGHKVEPAKPWARVLYRAECFRLVDLLANASDWTPEQVAKERENVLVDAGRVRLLALGRSRRADKNPIATVLARLQESVTAAGLDPHGRSMLDVRLHDLRRTMGSWAAMTGASLPVVGKALGHRSQQTTQIYARLDLDPVRVAVQAGASAMLAFDDTRTPDKKP